MAEARARAARRRALALSWGLLAAAGGLAAILARHLLQVAAAGEPVRWERPWAFVLLGACALVAWVTLHLRLVRAPALAFSRVADAAFLRRGAVARLAALPDVLRIVAIGLLAAALARPQTYRATTIEVEGIDIMLVLDLSRSMEERDLSPSRLDAGQRTIRSFLATRAHDRVGLVVFAQAAMLQCPLTLDHGALARIVAGLAIGDVPEAGTAIGDALALALASLRRSEARARIVILLSDGDSNFTTELTPDEARDLAVAMGVKVFTILVGKDEPSPPGNRYAVNPDLLREIAHATGGAFFRADDDRALQESFGRVASALETSRLRVHGHVLGAELFAWLLIPALLLLGLEQALRMSRWRRFP